jgi:hypothetical protein
MFHVGFTSFGFSETATLQTDVYAQASFGLGSYHHCRFFHLSGEHLDAHTRRQCGFQEVSNVKGIVRDIFIMHASCSKQAIMRRCSKQR